MRQIGTLPKGIDAKVFTDYLLTLGIKSRVDDRPEGGLVWIYNEDHVARASEELQSYQAEPHDPRYQQAVDSAAAIRRREQERDKEFRKNYREVSDLWAYPGLRRRPMTMLLMAICVVVFFMQESVNYGDWVETTLRISTEYGDREGVRHDNGLSDIANGQVWRLVTPIFLHFGIWHLVFNMWALSTFGTIIEIRRGTYRFALLVLVAAIVSNLGQFLYMQRVDPGVPHLFGGISGVVCALFGYIWMKGLYEPEQGMGLHPNSVTLMLFYLAVCMTGYLGPIANGAHVVGVAVGVAFGVLRF